MVEKLNQIIRQAVWNFLSSLPNAIEIIIWVLLGISVIALIEVVVFFIKRFIMSKKTKKTNSEFQLDMQQMKQETKEWMQCKDWKEKLIWYLRWRGKEARNLVIIILSITIIGLIMFFNFSYSKVDGASIKPSETPSEVIKKIKK